MVQKVCLQIIVLIVFNLSICGCSFLQQEEFADIAWETSGYGNDGNFDGCLGNGVLYQPEAYVAGISATRIADGNRLWQITDKFKPKTEPIISGERLYIFSEAVNTEFKNTKPYLFVFNKNTGTIVARVTLTEEPGSGQGRWWLACYQGWVYFCYYTNYNTPTQVISISRLQESAIQEIGDVEQLINPSLFLQTSSPFQIPADKILFDKDRCFVFFSGIGWRGPLPEGLSMTDGYYPQEAIRVVCTDLDGVVQWESNLKYTGNGMGGTHRLVMNNDRLFIADWSGAACLEKSNGNVVWESAGMFCAIRFVLKGNRLFSSGYKPEGPDAGSLYCLNADTGAIVWSQSTRFSLDSNPIIMHERVYSVMSDALRVFNKDTGELLYENKDWGIPGYRSQGYVPQEGNIIYLPRENDIIALKLRGM